MYVMGINIIDFLCLAILLSFILGVLFSVSVLSNDESKTGNKLNDK